MESYAGLLDVLAQELHNVELDLTQALGRDPITTLPGLTLTAAILDDLLARRTVGTRPADLADDRVWVVAASGRAAHPDNRLPLIG
jgi:hypothetical protein